MAKERLKNLSFKTRMSQPSSESNGSTRLETAAKAMERVLESVMIGYASDPSTVDTPARFAKYLAEFTQPIDEDSIFGSMFDIEDDHPGMVIQTGIPFRMMCEHHLLPATGIAHLAYIPHKRVIGLSKLARLVDAVAVSRPSLQEHIAEKIIGLVVDKLEPKGCMVILDAEHGCMACRGVNKPGVATITSHVQGVFRDNLAAREEMLSLIQVHNR